jgi:hypothetical protein
VSEDAPETEVSTPPAETQTPDAPRSYTQEDFDRVIGRTRSEERAKFADYETLKEKAERYDEAANAAKTAEERLQEQLADRERELEQLRTSTREATIRSSITAAASRKGIVDPDAAVKLIDATGIEFDDNGEPQNVDQLVDALVQDKQYLLGKPAPASFDGGVRTPPTPQTTDDPKAAIGAGLFEFLQSQR